MSYTVCEKPFLVILHWSFLIFRINISPKVHVAFLHFYYSPEWANQSVSHCSHLMCKNTTWFLRSQSFKAAFPVGSSFKDCLWPRRFFEHVSVIIDCLLFVYGVWETFFRSVSSLTFFSDTWTKIDKIDKDQTTHNNIIVGNSRNYILAWWED